MTRALRLTMYLLLAAGLVELVLQLMLPPFSPRVFLDDRSANVLRLAHGSQANARMFGRTVHISVDPVGDRVTPGQPSSGKVLHIVGDSQVFGWGLNDDETLPARVQQLLGPEWLVRNHGVPGYGPTQYKKLIDQLPKSEHVLLVFTEENDLWDSFDIASAGSYCGHMSEGWASRWSLPCSVLDSRLVQSLAAWLVNTGVSPTPIGFTEESTAAATVSSSRVMSWLAVERARRKNLVVSVVPWRGRISEELRRSYFPPANALQRSEYLPDECGARAQFRAWPRPQELFLPDDSHISALGARLLGQCLVDALRQRRNRERA